jgi:hypothetical protein
LLPPTLILYTFCSSNYFPTFLCHNLYLVSSFLLSYP